MLGAVLNVGVMSVLALLAQAALTHQAAGSRCKVITVSVHSTRMAPSGLTWARPQIRPSRFPHIANRLMRQAAAHQLSVTVAAIA